MEKHNQHLERKEEKTGKMIWFFTAPSFRGRFRTKITLSTLKQQGLPYDWSDSTAICCGRRRKYRWLAKKLGLTFGPKIIRAPATVHDRISLLHTILSLKPNTLIIGGIRALDILATRVIQGRKSRLPFAYFSGTPKNTPQNATLYLIVCNPNSEQILFLGIPKRLPDWVAAGL